MSATRDFAFFRVSPRAKLHVYMRSPDTAPKDGLKALCGLRAERPSVISSYAAGKAHLLVDELRRHGNQCAKCAVKVHARYGEAVQAFEREEKYGPAPVEAADRPMVAPLPAGGPGLNAQPLTLSLSGPARFHLLEVGRGAMCGSRFPPRPHHQGDVRFESLAAALEWLDKNPAKPRCQRCHSALEARVRRGGR